MIHLKDEQLWWAQQKMERLLFSLCEKTKGLLGGSDLQLELTKKAAIEGVEGEDGGEAELQTFLSSGKNARFCSPC